jgi:hypothetical protein
MFVDEFSCATFNGHIEAPKKQRGTGVYKPTNITRGSLPE